ncbi:MAG: hemolysin family protein [Bacteroidales bacterium]
MFIQNLAVSLYSIIIISLIFSAFFSGMEIAFIAANKLKIEVDKKSGALSARLMSRFVRSESSFISTMLVGNNVALVVYGVFFAILMEPVLVALLPVSMQSDLVILLLQTLVSSLIILIFAEFLPKVLFRINPNRFLNIFALPVTIIYYLLFPVIYLVMGLSRSMLSYFFNIDIANNKKVFDSVDINNFLKEFGNGKDQESTTRRELQIFRNAIEFPDVIIRECMIPRTEIVAVAEKESPDQVRKLFSHTGLSKILIYKDSIDNITGYVHAFDFFSLPEKLQPIIRPVMLVPETMHANKLLQNFIKQHKSIAVVIDEFGGTSGIITIEDIMEEIFGEIEDEYDVDILMERRVREGEYIFSARLEIDYLNEKFNLDLQVSDEYETLGGLILNHLESIPEKGQEILIGQLVVKILQVSQKRIELVQIKKMVTT